MTLFYAHQYVQTTLSKAGGLNDSATTGIVLASTDGIDTAKPSVALLDYQVPLDVTKAEWITYTSINGSKELVGVTRGAEGSTAKAHDNGCAIAFPLSESHINNLNDALLLEHNATGTHKVAAVTTYSPAGAGTTTIDLSLGNINIVTMPANTQTLAISNGATGQCFLVEINNVTSQGALTWFTTIRWSGGSAPTLTGTNGKRDVFGFIVTGSNTYDGYVVGQNI